MIPEFLDKPNVLGIGEIGLNKNTPNEATIFLEHLDLAAKYDQQILIHTPHLEDKFQGTKMIVDMLCDDRRIDHSRVLVDHVEEHTVRFVLDEGFWAGMTLVPGLEVHSATRRRHRRSVRSRTTAGEFGGRLGTVEADGGSRLHYGNAAPRPSGKRYPQDRLRQPGSVLQPKPGLSVSSTGYARDPARDAT